MTDLTTRKRRRSPSVEKTDAPSLADLRDKKRRLLLGVQAVDIAVAMHPDEIRSRLPQGVASALLAETPAVQQQQQQQRRLTAVLDRAVDRDDDRQFIAWQVFVQLDGVLYSFEADDYENDMRIISRGASSEAVEAYRYTAEIMAFVDDMIGRVPDVSWDDLRTGVVRQIREYDTLLADKVAVTSAALDALIVASCIYARGNPSDPTIYGNVQDPVFPVVVSANAQ